jgi:D-glucosaminate-6-phosphate ammonia-lyase
MTPTRRLLLQAAALMPFSKARAARKAGSVYAQLGIRPVINMAGTQTIYGASKIWDELHESMAEASREYIVLAELQEKVG